MFYFFTFLNTVHFGCPFCSFLPSFQRCIVSMQPGYGGETFVCNTERVLCLLKLKTGWKQALIRRLGRISTVRCGPGKSKDFHLKQRRLPGISFEDGKKQHYPPPASQTFLQPHWISPMARLPCIYAIVESWADENSKYYSMESSRGSAARLVNLCSNFRTRIG